MQALAERFREMLELKERSKGVTVPLRLHLGESGAVC